MNRREVILGAAALTGCAAAARAPAFPLRRAVSLGNALEAPHEGDWGYRIGEAHLAAIAAAGFDGIRLPVRWDPHATPRAPYAIDPAFMARVETVIGWAIAHGLKVQLDCHHYDDLLVHPERERTRYLSIWRQIASRFASAPDALLFEPLNEPNGGYWTGRRLSALQTDVLRVIRESNPTRRIVFGGPNWNSVDGLDDWSPPRDANVAATFHYYEPHDFTHEDAEWLRPDAPRFDRAWGSARDVAQVQTHLRRAAAWVSAHGLALQLGEFGVNRAVGIAQRALWTKTVRQTAEAAGIGWCAWDFAGAFPIYDVGNAKFIPELRDALFGA